MVGTQTYDVVIIGGGPAGAAAGRLLASWGLSICILHKPADRARGLAESVPPSTRKLLAAIGVLDGVEHARFYPTGGNTVWWGSREGRVERFDAGDTGLQVFRPDFDDLLLDEAARAGADVRRPAVVRRVQMANEPLAQIECDHEGGPLRVRCRFVLDCSGRAGILAKAHRRIEPSYRMYAMVGVWCRPGGWPLPDETHTLVETYQDGWVWSVPLSATVRHVGTMVDGTSPRVGGGRRLADAYRGEIAKAFQMSTLLHDADLQRIWACDAALYSSETYAGPRFLLVGDAGSFIDPLSSFGIKKALASAWLAAIVVNTCLTHPERQAIAQEFFSRREHDVYRSHLRRSRDFARAAHAHHPHPFWACRAATDVARTDAVDEDDLLRDPLVGAALDALRRSPAIDLQLADGVRIEQEAVIRGREIVLEEAISLAGLPPPRVALRRAAPERRAGGNACATGVTPASGATGSGLTGSIPVAQPFRAASIRFLNNVDLLSLARIACRHTQVPDVFEAYCRAHGHVALPGVLGALSFLVARGILRPRV
jgi:flavin-dependent dehydrogenase